MPSPLTVQDKQSAQTTLALLRARGEAIQGLREAARAKKAAAEAELAELDAQHEAVWRTINDLELLLKAE